MAEVRTCLEMTCSLISCKAPFVGITFDNRYVWIKVHKSYFAYLLERSRESHMLSKETGNSLWKFLQTKAKIDGNLHITHTLRGKKQHPQFYFEVPELAEFVHEVNRVFSSSPLPKHLCVDSKRKTLTVKRISKFCIITQHRYNTGLNLCNRTVQ